MSQDLSDAEFLATKALLRDHGAVVDETALASLIARRFVRPEEDGHVVTLDGHAAFIHRLGKQFKAPGE